jgi:transcriptional regulator
MYVRADHRPKEPAHAGELIRRNMFATLIGASPEGLIASHLPFMFDHERGAHGTLVSHMARANPHTALLGSGQEMLVIFTGAHGYMSPSWYPDRRSAPAWNYAAVHCYGTPVVQSARDSERIINALVDLMEGGRANRWSADELGAGGVAEALQGIVCFEIEVTRLEAKFKMGQGERPGNLRAAITRLEAEGRDELVEYMREYNDLPA